MFLIPGLIIVNIMTLDLSKIPIPEFSKYGERKVEIEFMKRGWDVFRPLVDRYIDLVVSKNFCNNDKCGRDWNPENVSEYVKCEKCGSNKKPKEIIRTIQVKSSRLEKGGKKPSFAINHRPKDLLPDEKHFFVWYFHESSVKENFMIIRPSDFAKLVGSGVNTQTWIDHTHRYHITKNRLTHKIYEPFLNKWDTLHKKFKDNPINDILKNAKNSDKRWKSEISPPIWKKNSKELVDFLENKFNKEDIEDIINNKSEILKFKKARKKTYSSTPPKITSTPTVDIIEKLSRHLKDDFMLVQDNWRVYNKIEGAERLVLKIQCSKCKYPWPVDEKECYFCKSWSPPAVYCETCETAQPDENKQNCPVCKNNNQSKILKKKRCPHESCGKKLEDVDIFHKSNPTTGKRKSCPHCKQKFNPSIPNDVCPKCETNMIKINTKCKYCEQNLAPDVKIEKTCFVCKKPKKKYDFQPITFCQKCGERKSEFEICSI